MFKLLRLISIAGLSFTILYAHEVLINLPEDDIVKTDIMFDRMGCADCGITSLENIRGKDAVKAYKSQDRVCAITIKPIGIENIAIEDLSIIDLVKGKIPKPHIQPGVFLMGVFDGHGTDGDTIASLSRYFVCDYFKKFFEQSYTKLLYHHFLVLGDTIQSLLSSNVRAQESGTTACLCLFEGPLEGHASHDLPIKLYRAVFCNVGDSRAIVISGNEVVFSTLDHKPTMPSELSRIKQAGGCIINGYAYGLNNTCGFLLSRSWGDCAAHKNGVLLHTPEIHSFGIPMQASNALLKIKEDAQYLVDGDIIVCATDGLWDVFTNQEVAAYIYKQKLEGVPLQIISEELAQKARTGDNNAHEISKDDISVLIIELGI